MDQGFIMPGRKGQISDDRREAQVVGAQHAAGHDDNKPLKSGLTGKAGTEGKQNRLNEFQQGSGLSQSHRVNDLV
jgi:hypothetical protein